MRSLVSKVWPTVTFLSSLLLILAFQNCGQPGAGSGGVSSQATQASSQPVSLTGTIQKSQLDGCQYLIAAQDENGNKQNFIPVDLDPTLLKDGNVVSISGQIRGDLNSVCMAGPVLQVDQAALVH